jgi:hypothetical protein
VVVVVDVVVVVVVVDVVVEVVEVVVVEVVVVDVVVVVSGIISVSDSTVFCPGLAKKKEYITAASMTPTIRRARNAMENTMMALLLPKSGFLPPP